MPAQSALREVSMRRLAIGLCVWTATALTLSVTGNSAYGQPAAAPAGSTEASPPAEPPGEAPAALPQSSDATAAEVAGARTPTDDVKLKGEKRWEDIAVLPRRYTLKAKRVEI